MSLALVGALALHIGVMSMGRTSARAESPSVSLRPMTVRTIAPVTAPAALSAPPETAVAQSSPVAPAETGRAAGRVDVQPIEPAPNLVPRATRAAIEPASSPVVAAAATTVDAKPPAPAPAPSPSVTAALPAAPQYLMAARLDPGPQPIGDIEPVYPESAHLQEGTVVLRVLISESGHVDNVAVARSNPKGYFEEAAIEAFSKAEFTPGRAAGVAVKSQITVEVHFLPINRGRISGRGY